jgi:hypothetical protein
MNYTFVVGLERCGTHSIANILKKSCLVQSYIEHEPLPHLCYEASQFIDNQEWLTPGLENRIQFYKNNDDKFEFICEVNHRLSFFVNYLGNEFPESKFILMIRDPIKTLVSRVATLAHWPDIIDRYPKFYQDKIKKLVPNGKDLFNTYRPKPANFDMTIQDIYLWEWIETYRIVSKQIKNFNHIILETKMIANSVVDILNFIDGTIFDSSIALQESKKRIDSAYENIHMSDTVVYAWDLFEPHMNKIKDRIREEFPNDTNIERIIS